MENTKECKSCIWFDQCGQEATCDGYYPVSPEEQNDALTAEYEDELRERHRHYISLVEEQDS